jgi:hypothetical protein
MKLPRRQFLYLAAGAGRELISRVSRHFFRIGTAGRWEDQWMWRVKSHES